MLTRGALEVTPTMRYPLSSAAAAAAAAAAAYQGYLQGWQVPPRKLIDGERSLDVNLAHGTHDVLKISF